MVRSNILAVLVGAMLAWLAPPAWSIVHWDGSTSDDWHTASNWVGGQVPLTTDDVYVTDPSNGTFVQLSDSAFINFLFVDSGMQVSTAGHQLFVGPGVPLGPFPGIVVGDSGASVIVPPGSGIDLATSRFDIADGGSLSMFGGYAIFTRQDSLIRTGGQVSGFGTLDFRHEGVSSTVLENDGTIRPALGSLTLVQMPSTTLDLDGPSNAGYLDVDDGTGILSGAVALHIEGDTAPFHGTIDIGTHDLLTLEEGLDLGLSSGTEGGHLAFHGRTGVARLFSSSYVNVANPDSRIDVVSGDAELSASLALAGPLTLADSTTLHANGDTANFGSVTTVGAGATLTLDYFLDGGGGSFDGAFIFDNASFTGPGQIINQSKLTLEHGATIFSGSLLNDGLIVVGLQGWGQVEVGTFTNSDKGTLQFEIFGPSPSDNDLLLIQGNGASTLGGTLEVTLDNYVPSLNEQFTLIQAGAGMNGMFDLTVLPATPSGTRWKVLYSPIEVSLALLVDGDFNGNGTWECADVDALVARIAEGNHNIAFDLTGDALVTTEDLNEWLLVAGQENLSSGNAYLIGDANLDGSVDGQDFVAWNADKFRSVAAWCRGDFNADGEVDGQDFVLWNANKFMSADAITSVPEPRLLSAYALVALVVVWTASRGRTTP